MKNFLKIFIIFSLASCAYKPILDPHGKYKEVGAAQAQDDIDECDEEADDYLDQFKAERAAREAARKAVIGGVVGAGTGLLFNRTLKGTLFSSAIGAGIGAAVGALSVAGEDKALPSEIKQRYMINCLARKGYSVIGWK